MAECINNRIYDYYRVHRRKAQDLSDLLVFLAGDVDRYLTALDAGSKKEAERELGNVRVRSRELNELLAKERVTT